MFHHRMGNVLPLDVADALPGFSLDASKGAVLAIVCCDEFRRWATRRWGTLNGQTPIDACIARDLEDVRREDKIHTRLNKRYGGGSPEGIRAAVANAHVRIKDWTGR